MIKETYFCDMCDGDGEEVLAVCTYTGDGDEKFNACRKHLKDVKKAGLDYEMLDGHEDEKDSINE